MNVDYSSSFSSIYLLTLLKKGFVFIYSNGGCIQPEIVSTLSKLINSFLLGSSFIGRLGSSSVAAGQKSI
jgi:hypothetical protein